MIKKYLLILVVLFVCQSATAQKNENEAKAAYLLAEESYAKGDYKAALEFLAQVREALGGANCKLIYLQIITTREQYAKDTGMNNKLLLLINEFEKSPDYTDFNEEKKLEITKLKLLAKKEIKAAQDKSDADIKTKEAETKLKAEHEKGFAEVVSKWPALFITLAQLDSARPDWKITEWKKTSWANYFDVFYPAGFSYNKSSYPFAVSKDNMFDTGRVSNLVVSEGKITCYCRYLVDFDGSANKDDGPGYEAAKQAIVQSRAIMTEKTGLQPGGFDAYPEGGYTKQQLEWHHPNYMIIDYSRFRAKGSSGVVQLVRCVFGKK